MWNLAGRAKYNHTRKARSFFPESEMNKHIIMRLLILLLLVVALSIVIYAATAVFSEHQEYSSNSLSYYLLTPAELSGLSEKCKDKPIFVYSSADGPKPTVVTMNCTIATRDFENQMSSSGFRYIDGLYQKGSVQIEVIKSSDGKKLTSVALIGEN